MNGLLKHQVIFLTGAANGMAACCDVVADAAVLLLSDRARLMTGCIFPVTGGAEPGYRRGALTRKEG